MHTTTASHITPAQLPSPRFAPRCTKDIRSAILAGFLLLAFLSTATAADFSGSLKGVSITDAQAANKPPVAAFTYKQEGEIITFDASGSSDTDGSITKYKWDFGNGTVTEGATAAYALTGTANLQVTLTVVDNNNGVTMNQQTVTPATTKGIHDDFTTDTTANYTVISGKALNISDGVLRTSSWSTTVAYHKTSLGNSDHSIEADIAYVAGYSGGLLARFDPAQKTGYLVWFESGKILLNKYSNGTITYLALYDGKYTDGKYKLNVTITGNTITVTVNGTVILTKADTSFISGNHVGVRLRAGADPTLVIVDNLAGN